MEDQDIVREFLLESNENLVRLDQEIVELEQRPKDADLLEDVALNATAQRLNLITTELQEGVMKTRMQPIGLVWNKLPRLVRDVSHALDKQVRLEMDGAGTEIDKTIIEAIKVPLTHLVRNACDHGIERPEERVQNGKPAHGTLHLRAYHEAAALVGCVLDRPGSL